MMILAAVVLLIGFIALAGMVGRVSQLASQTTVESEQAILKEVGPLADSLDQAICRLKASTVTKASVANGVTTAGSTTLTSATAAFAAADIGMVVSGSGLPPGTRILAVGSATSVTLTAPATASATGVTLRFASCLASGTTTPFNLAPTGTSPTLEVGVIAVLEHLQALVASRGLFMDWELGCADLDGDGAANDADDVAGGQAKAHLWDGTVWVEVRSAVAFTRSAC